MASPAEIPTGHVGNNSPSQDEKLQQLWGLLIRSWSPEALGKAPSTNASTTTAKSHRRWFSLSRAQPTEEDTSAIPAQLLSSLNSLGADANDIKTIQSLQKKLPGEELRSAYFNMLKQDHPDGLLLRFIRAEKWNIPKAYIKFVRALHWRVKEYHVSEEVLLKGEEHALEKARSAKDQTEEKDGEGFVVQLRTGKGHVHGCDKWGRPICIVRVRCHNPSEQTAKGLNDFIIHCCETIRLLMTPPVETMSIVFDLSSFSLSNWDLPPIKFIIQCFQENYPESLGAMIFYNAPWVFSGCWKLIHGLLDPVVASKVYFISGAKELEKLVPREHIIKELGGETDWEYEYVEPEPNENDRLQDTDTRDAILAERTRLVVDFFQLTTEWVSSTSEETDSSLKSRREEIVLQLRANYWKLDPHVRSRSWLDRTGVIQEGGKIEFYPPAKQPQAQANGNGDLEKLKLSHVEDTQATQQATAATA